MMFSYIISGTIRRSHINPPFTDYHSHDFLIHLHLESPRKGLYGVDMVQVERELNQWLDSLPDPINEHPEMRSGTTEQFCEALVKAFQHLPLVKVEVGETPQRITGLCCQ